MWSAGLRVFTLPHRFQLPIWRWTQTLVAAVAGAQAIVHVSHSARERAGALKANHYGEGVPIRVGTSYDPIHTFVDIVGVSATIIRVKVLALDAEVVAAPANLPTKQDPNV